MYNRIICGIDLSDDGHALVTKALELARDPDKVHLAHVGEHPITGYGEMTGHNHQVTECQIRQAIYPHLERLAKHHRLHSRHIHIPFGKPAHALHQLAEELDADLIVIGSHGHQGLRLLLGSTANSVLHGAKCDVLTLRLRDE